MIPLPSRRQQFLLLVLVLALCDLAQLVGVPAVREVFTIPAVLVLPGWAFLLAVRASPDDHDPMINWLAAAAMLTLAIWPLLVLALAALSIKITHGSVMYAFNAAVLCALSGAVVAEWRASGNGTPPEESSVR